VPDKPVDNAFVVQRKQFLRHVVRGGPFPYAFLSGATGVRQVEAGPLPWLEKRFAAVRELVVESAPA
jgi:hypothetical protein